MPRAEQPSTPEGLRPVTPFRKGLETRVLRYVRRNRVLNPGERVLVAVSGGQDSLTLLLVLARLGEELGIEPAVAHFDHMLRSREEAGGDEAAGRGLARALGLTCALGPETCVHAHAGGGSR